MFVAATTRCFADLPLEAALQRLVDLEYTSVEIMIHEAGGHLKPSECWPTSTPPFGPAGRPTGSPPVPSAWTWTWRTRRDYYAQFTACCKLAKAVKVVTLTVRAAELGTPFNAEVERLRALAAIASMEGVRVGLLTEAGRMSQDPDTAVVLCDSVQGLGISLDPSHYICGPHRGGNFEQVMKYVYHVRLRDTSKDQLQVRVGQGEVEYGRLINQLNKVGYDRALCVDILPVPDMDQFGRVAEDAALAGEPAVTQLAAHQIAGKRASYARLSRNRRART